MSGDDITRAEIVESMDDRSGASRRRSFLAKTVGAVGAVLGVSVGLSGTGAASDYSCESCGSGWYRICFEDGSCTSCRPKSSTPC